MIELCAPSKICIHFIYLEKKSQIHLHLIKECLENVVNAYKVDNDAAGMRKVSIS